MRSPALAAVFLPLVAACVTAKVPDLPPPPPLRGVVLVLVDDLGWMDLGCQGSTIYETPHLDRLADQGMRFTNAYAAAAICSPTRAAVQTGRSPARLGITDWIRARFQGGRIPADGRNPSGFTRVGERLLEVPCNPLWLEHSEVTLAELLAPAGHATGHIGKWHLGPDDWYPERQGYCFNRGGCDYGQPPSYFDPYERRGQGGLFQLAPRREGEYLTDREADEAIEFLRANCSGRFFLHLAPYAVHTPIQAKEELVAHYTSQGMEEPIHAKYAAMVHSVDEAVGRILATLDELGIADETLVIFTSDNGGLSRVTDNAPLRAGKGYPYEGGLRVPLLVLWPGVVPAGTVSNAPVISMDLLPTIAAACGQVPPAEVELDGIDLLDHLRTGGARPLDRDALVWHFPHYRGPDVTPYSILRAGRWKLIQWWEGPRFELYDLEADPGEEHDLGETHPAEVEELRRRLDAELTRLGARRPRVAD